MTIADVSKVFARMSAAVDVVVSSIAIIICCIILLTLLFKKKVRSKPAVGRVIGGGCSKKVKENCNTKGRRCSTQTVNDCSLTIAHQHDDNQYTQDIILNDVLVSYAVDQKIEIEYNPVDPNDFGLKTLSYATIALIVLCIMIIPISVIAWSYFVFTNDTAAHISTTSRLLNSLTSSTSL